MGNILIGYTTNSGSTRDVADVLAGALIKSNHKVDVRLLSRELDLQAYDAVIIGAPIILGWHSDAITFIKKNQAELAKKNTAFFACALKLTRNPAVNMDSVPLTLDPSLIADPQDERKLQFKERFTTVDHYVVPMVSSASSIKPVSIAFFNGKLDMKKLNIFQKIFVRFVVQAEPGDFRNWDFIKNWSNEISKKFSM